MTLRTLSDTMKTNGPLDVARAQEAVSSAKSQLQGAQDAVAKAKLPYAHDLDVRSAEEAVASAQ